MRGGRGRREGEGEEGGGRERREGGERGKGGGRERWRDRGEEEEGEQLNIRPIKLCAWGVPSGVPNYPKYSSIRKVNNDYVAIQQ